MLTIIKALFKAKKEHVAAQRVNVYTKGYGSKPFPNAYAHL